MDELKKMRELLDKKLLEHRLEDLDRTEPYEDGSYTWASFLSDAPYKEVEQIVEQVKEDVLYANLDEDEYSADLEWMTDKVKQRLKEKGYLIFNIPYTCEYQLKE